MPKLDKPKPEPISSDELRPGGNAQAQILSFVERVERLTEEIDALGEDRKEVFAEAKGTGFDTKILREVIRRRKANKADVQEHDAILELYEEAVRRAEAAQLKKSQDEAL